MPALFFAISNAASVYSEFCLKGGLDIGFVEANEADLKAAVKLAISLAIAGSVGLTLGLVSLSLWLIKLTALARKHLFSKSSMQDALEELKGKNKYFSSVWLWGFLYLLAPLLPLSVLLSFSIMSGMNLNFYGEPLFYLPPDLLLYINTAALLFFLLVIDYSLLLTVLSSSCLMKARELANFSADLLVKKSGDFFVLNMALLSINLLVSCPFLLFPFSGNAYLQGLGKSLPFAVACQFWLAATSIIVWPLSVLIFAEYLKPLLSSMETEPQ